MSVIPKITLEGTPIISSFTGDYYFLSNFYPVIVNLDGLFFQDAEAAYQMQKCVDPKDRLQFTELTRGKAKRRGKEVALRPDWEQVKFSCMQRVLQNKFSYDTPLADLLLETGNAELIEGNYWGDTVWGVCEKTGKGQNFLGKALMARRYRLRQMKAIDL